jgi:dTDP-glucose pyrophosphorylase
LSRPFTLLITAAGAGRRFQQAGVQPAKPLIRVQGISLLQHALASFELPPGSTCLISGQTRHGLRKALDAELHQQWPDLNLHWIELNQLQPGQLATACESLEQWLSQSGSDPALLSQPLLIHNCDTGFRWHHQLLPQDSDACMPVFEAEGDHWSFGVPHPDEPSQAVAIAEKQRISNLASIGLYGFASLELFRELATRQLANGQAVNGEHYIAPLLQAMLEQGYRVSLPRVEGVQLYGTPAELCNQFGISLSELQRQNR